MITDSRTSSEFGRISAPRAIERRLFDAGDGTFFQQEPELHPLCERFLLAGREAGYVQLRDHGLEAANGVCRYRRTQRLGRRQTTFSVFLESTSVKIVENASVDQVLLDDQTATGVRVQIGNESIDLLARKGVILTAGAIHSPLILQASGIGPAEVLRRAGLDRTVLVEQVGENLQDHLVFPLIYGAREVESMVPMDDPFARIEYAKHRTGPLASNIAEVGGFSSFQSTPGTVSAPDIQWHFTPTHYLEYPTRKDPRCLDAVRA